MNDSARLSFNFAKRHGVFISKLTPDFIELTYAEQANPQAFIELRRHYQKPVRLQRVSEDRFEVRARIDRLGRFGGD